MPVYIIRMQVYVRDQLTKNELQLFHLQLQPRDSIDTAKYMLSMQMWERHGKFPKLSSFQLEQSGKRLRFTDPVTCRFCQNADVTAVLERQTAASRHYGAVCV